MMRTDDVDLLLKKAHFIEDAHGNERMLLDNFSLMGRQPAGLG